MVLRGVTLLQPQIDNDNEQAGVEKKFIDHDSTSAWSFVGLGAGLFVFFPSAKRANS
jgi:hypothetical protein